MGAPWRHAVQKYSCVQTKGERRPNESMAKTQTRNIPVGQTTKYNRICMSTYEGTRIQACRASRSDLIQGICGRYGRTDAKLGLAGREKEDGEHD